KMGVNMYMIRQGNLEQILPLIAEGFKANVDPMQQASAAQALFGKSWQDVLPLLNRGKAGLEAVRAALEANGIITAEQSKAAEVANQAWKDMAGAVKGARNAIAAELLPAITPLVNGMADFIKNNRELLKQAALPVFIGSIAVAVGALGKAVIAATG